MTFTQHVEPCTADEHSDCTAIVCRRDSTGDVVWVSHLHSDVHAEHRINPDHPAKRNSRKVAHKPVSGCKPCEQHPAWRAVQDTAR